MRRIVDIYTETVRRELRPLFANWEPSQPINLGDYGILAGNFFIRTGNLSDLHISFQTVQDTRKSLKSFTSGTSTEVKFHAKGAANVSVVANAKACLEINFGSSEEAVFFNAADCNFNTIKDKNLIGQTIMERYQNDRWDRSWAVVTDIVKAGATTIAISGGKNSSVIFEAMGDVEKIDLADASIGLSVSSRKNIGFVIEAKQGLIPLIGLSKIQSKFFWFHKDFHPLLYKDWYGFSDPIIATMEDSKYIQTEETPEDIYFGQIM